LAAFIWPTERERERELWVMWPPFSNGVRLRILSFLERSRRVFAFL